MQNPFSALRGPGFLFQAIALARQPEIRPYIYIPLMINVVVFIGLIFLIATLLGDLITLMMPSLPEWLQWLEWIFWLFFAISSVILVFFTFSIVANIIASPFCALLAEAVERKVSSSQENTPFSLKAFTRDFFPTIWDEIRRLRYTLSWMAIGLLLFVIPVVNLAAPFIWIVISSWLLAFEYSGYHMSNKQLKLADQLTAMRRQRFLLLGFGGTTLIATMIPLINFIIMPLAVIAGTLVAIQLTKESEQI